MVALHIIAIWELKLERALLFCVPATVSTINVAFAARDVVVQAVGANKRLAIEERALLVDDLVVAVDRPRELWRLRALVAANLVAPVVAEVIVWVGRLHRRDRAGAARLVVVLDRLLLRQGFEHVGYHLRDGDVALVKIDAISRPDVRHVLGQRADAGPARARGQGPAIAGQ